MTRVIPRASGGGASLTVDTGPAVRSYDSVSQKSRAGPCAPQPAGPGELRSAPLFAGVDESTLSRLSADARIESLQDGDVLFHQGAVVTDLACVLSGYVKLLRISSSGRQTLIGIRSDGEIIGEAPTDADESHALSAKAVGATRVLKLPAALFARLVKESPSLCAAVMQNSKESIARLLGEIESLKSQNADQRLASFL
ncbi:MAG: Crp/Fnr family transcriptional regulator, partial [Methylocystis sp.]